MNRFPRVLGVRYGYDPDQVDALIRRIESTLGRGAPTGDPITADEIRGSRFRVKLGGYNETAVDYALDAFIVAVETLTAGRRSAADLAGAGDGPRAGTAAEPPDGPETASAVPSAQVVSVGDPSAVESVPAVSAEGPSAADVPAVPSVPPARPVVEAEVVTAASAGDPSEVGGVPAVPPVVEAEVVTAVSAGDPPEVEVVPAAVRPTVQDSGQGSGSGGEQRPERRPGGEGNGGPPARGDGDPVLSGEEEAARIERVAFRSGRLGMGYDEEEVDLFLDRVAATLRGTTDQPVTPDDVREARFSTVVFRPGYAVSQVDDFLHDLVDVVERHLGR
ncbi:DivIVA domain-containing protein [Planomonospora algeriensis]